MTSGRRAKSEPFGCGREREPAPGNEARDVGEGRVLSLRKGCSTGEVVPVKQKMAVASEQSL